MLDQSVLLRVSHHSVIRYLERVLGLPVDEWLVGCDHLNDYGKAQIACERAGLPVDAVRLSMLIEPVLKAMQTRSSQKAKIITRDAIYVVTGGNLVTVLAPGMQAFRKRKYKAYKSRKLEEV
jgi:hypothetical protein